MSKNKNFGEMKPSTSNTEQVKKVFRVGVSPLRTNPKIGPLRSHLYNYAFAKNESLKEPGSKIVFRVDDTDKEKHSKDKAVELFRFFTEDLGLSFDITPSNSHDEIGQSVFQSERQELYKKYVEEMFDKHVAFLDKPSGLVLFDIEKFADQYTSMIEINDLQRGRFKFDIEGRLRNNQRYFPLLRSDKSALYHLASVVDDGEFGVTHVVRGIDKFSIAEFQEMIRVSLALQPKDYLHTPLLLDEGGKRLRGAVSYNDFIKQGFMPHALISYMISSGYGDPDAIYPSIDRFIEGFDYTKVHKNNGKFDLKKLAHINKRIAKETSETAFIQSTLIYLHTIQKYNVADALEKSASLKELLLTLRRPPKESAEILTSIITPEFETISKEKEPLIAGVITMLEEVGYDFSLAHEKLKLSPVECYGALNWILTGKQTFPKIQLVFYYLHSNNLLGVRVQEAKMNLGTLSSR